MARTGEVKMGVGSPIYKKKTPSTNSGTISQEVDPVHLEVLFSVGETSVTHPGDFYNFT